MQIDIWHTHAAGLYSDISTQQGQNVSTIGQMYVHGYQVTDAVCATAPYNSRGTRSTRNATDGIFNNNTGLILALQRPSDGSAGYVGTFTLGLAR